MGQQQNEKVASERDADFDAKRFAYEEEWSYLSWLIDNPDKSVSVNEYRAQIKKARTAVAAAHKAMIMAYRG